jgi:hypothetical protein
MAPSFYSQYPKFHVAVDCIIFGFDAGQLKVLLQKRPFEPRQGEWSLMGGFVKRDEDVDEAAKRVLFQLTGLHDIYMQQVGAFGSVNRDSGDRVVSVAYFALVEVSDVNDELTHQNSAYWESINEMPPLLFDHRDMVERALNCLRALLHSQPVGFRLLPPLFTLSQLQQLYEAILGKQLDKRNFRKRINEMNYIEKTDLIDKLSSKRGAALFQFNQQVYEQSQLFKL